MRTTLRTGAPVPYGTREEAAPASQEVAEAFQAWRETPMGQELTTASEHPRVAAFRQAWQRLPSADLPDGPGTAAGPYGDVGRTAEQLVERAVAANAQHAQAGQPPRFAVGDVEALRALATLAERHGGRLAVTLPPGITGPAPVPRAAAPQVATPRTRVATPAPRRVPGECRRSGHAQIKRRKRPQVSTPEQPVPATPAWRGAAAEALKLDSPMPLQLLTDWEIQERQIRLIRAEEATRRLAEAEAPDGAFRMAQLLADQGADQELIERARAAAREDQLYAREQHAKAHARAERLHEQTEQVDVEVHRRQQLTPAQQQAEAVERWQERTAAPAHTSRPAIGRSAFAPQLATDQAQRQGESR
ncbi:hypothetical protein [Streptomyces sp. NPDC049915]|uniref:hypothetical protein n=1 Tax=Streptomyces sp. NPDC049915 TaxID=3155510 RepID=UPI0034418F4E